VKKDFRSTDREGFETPRRVDKALSAAAVRGISEPGRYTDGNCLHLVVDSNGSKKWVLRVTIHGKRRDMGLGSASLISLAEAREEAMRWRKIARTGGDPLAVRRGERRVVPVFEDAARQFFAEHSKSLRNERHARQWITSLETYVFPRFGRRRVDHVQSSDVLEVLTPIWTTIPETASRVRQRIKVVFDWAKASGYRPGDNPVDGISRVLPKRSRKQAHHPALPYAELPAFIHKLREQEGVSTRLAYEFLILTCSRTAEVLLAKWKEIHWDAKTWTVPAERMKAKVEHKVPLSVRALEILTEANGLRDGGEYIFPGRLKKPLSNMAFDMALRRMKYDHITTHGMRSTFRDWAEERTSFSNSVVDCALAHTVRDKVEAAYLRTRLFEKRQQLMETWSQFATAPAAKVVGIRA
jgi:integrase